MDEVKVFKLQTMVKKLKDQIKIKTEIVIFKLGGICFRIVLGRQGCGIVLDIGVLRANLKQRAGSSSQIKFDGTKVYFREVFHGLHSEIFKACCIIGVQKLGVFVG